MVKMVPHPSRLIVVLPLTFLVQFGKQFAFQHKILDVILEHNGNLAGIFESFSLQESHHCGCQSGKFVGILGAI
jgi:hypothetical protein